MKLPIHCRIIPSFSQEQMVIRQSGNLWINLRKPPEWGLNRLWESYVSIGPLGYLHHFAFFVLRLILPHLTYSTFDPPLSFNQFSSFSLTTNAIFVPFYKTIPRASLVAQWLRIHLPMQGTRVQALVWEDPTCRGATGPVSHNYWACASGACAPQQERPHSEWPPLAATRESPRTETKTQHSQKIKKN